MYSSRLCSGHGNSRPTVILWRNRLEAWVDVARARVNTAIVTANVAHETSSGDAMECVSTMAAEPGVGAAARRYNGFGTPLGLETHRAKTFRLSRDQRVVGLHLPEGHDVLAWMRRVKSQTGWHAA